MACGQCGAANREGARFCADCGSALALTCTSCRAALNPNARFCDQCGTPVGTPAAPPSPTPAAPGEAVRKTVTVMFADLGGSTGFGERVDPESAREVIGRYHAFLQEVIDAHRGTVAKFTGDGLMALFGVPEVAEDDAARAVAAGADMQSRFVGFAADVADRYGETLTFRVGINTGEVVIAEGDADLVGDALNVAARLEKACAPGRVLVGEETWRLTRGNLAYEALGEVTVAGRSEPVAIFELQTDADPGTELATPFVGREDELRRLRASFDDTVALQEARFVTVLGSPGVGKTRLSRELAAITKHEARSFELRCDRAGEATFAPIVELILAAVGELDGTLDTEVTPERLAQLIVAADDAERERIVEGLSGIVGLAPARSTEETFWSVRRLVESLATEQPVVLVIDDIQWAESLLLELLEHLAEWVRGVGFLLVGLARPELREVRPKLTEPGRQMADVVALDGLDSAATEQLAARLLGTDHLPAGLVERLPASTDGNPLFVRELVRMLVDDHIIEQRGDAWELVIEAEAVEVPPTIQSLLAARVERLPDDERSVLERAAVIGSEFSLGALRDLVGSEGLALLDVRLERLRQKELVEPTGTYWGDEPLHRFHHVLIRDATYRRLLKGVRAELHERAGRWTDDTASRVVGEHEAAIAFHYEQAHEYRRQLGTLDDAGRALGHRAAELLTVAASRALERDDLMAAGTLAVRAIDRLDEGAAGERADLLLIGCEALLSSGDVTAARPLVQQLRDLSVGDDRLAAWASCFDAQMVSLTDPDGLVGAEEAATAAAVVLEGLGDAAGSAKAHLVRAGALARLGQGAGCELELDLALSSARAADDRRRVIAVLGTAPLAALWGPSPVARAGGRCLDVVRLLRITSASPAVEATSMRCQAVLEALRGRLDTARSMLARARVIVAELGLQRDLMETELFTGIVELIAEDPAEAEAPLRAAYGGLGRMGVGADAGQAAALLARSLFAQGRFDEADEMASASEALAGQNLKSAIAWRGARAELLAAQGQYAQAIALAEEAVAIAAGTDLLLDHADACVALARVHQVAGDERRASAARAEAARLYTAKGAMALARQQAATVDETGTDEPASPGREAEHATVAENAVTRRMREACHALTIGDHAANVVSTSPSFVQIDRRPGMQHRVEGREAAEASSRALHEVLHGARYEVAEVVAIRGDRLALVRNVVRGRFEVEVLVLQEQDPEGLDVFVAVYETSQLDEAMAELDERWTALRAAGGVGEPEREAVRLARAICHAITVGDFAALSTRLSPSYVAEDRRPGMINRVEGVELNAEHFRIFHEVLHGAPYEIEEVLAQRGDRLNVTRNVVRGRFQVELLSFGEWDVDGLLLYTCVFEVDQLEEAMAELDARWAAQVAARQGGEASTRHLPSEGEDAPAWSVEEFWRGNVCAEAALAFADRFWERDFDGMRSLVAADFVLADRRPDVTAPHVQGRDAFVDQIRQLVEEFGLAEVRCTVSAVRGKRVALVRIDVVNADGWEGGHLAVYEGSDEGCILRGTLFDRDDHVGAQDLLDDWYLEGEGAEHRRWIEHARAGRRTFNARDWDLFDTLYDPDMVLRDHRPGSFTTQSYAEWKERRRSQFELVPDVIEVQRWMCFGSNAAWGILSQTGTTPEGSAYEWLLLVVIQVDDAGRQCTLDLYGPDQLDDARARFEELDRPRDESTVGNELENAASRAQQLAAQLVLENRFDEAEALIADDFVRIDRRRGVSAPDAVGAREMVAAWRAFGELGFTDNHLECLAVRGERHCLSRATFRTPEGNEVVFLSMLVLDSSGRSIRSVNFDMGDLAAAIDELDERYLADEGVEHPTVGRDPDS